MAKTLAFDIICPNSRTRNTLEFAINQNGKGRFVNSKGKPDLVIVDCENPETLTDFKRFRERFPHCPAILLFNQHEDTDNTDDLLTGRVDYLVRPFSVKDLMQKIDWLIENSYSPGQETSSPRNGAAARPNLTLGTDEPKVAQTFQKPAATPQNNELKTYRTLPVSIAEDYTQNVRTINLSATTNDANNPYCPVLNTALPIEKHIDTNDSRNGDIDLGSASELQRIQMSAANRLLGHFTKMLASAAPDPTAICLTLNDTLCIHFDPATKMVSRSGERFDLPEIAQLELKAGQVSIRRETAQQSLSESCELEAFLWKLALYTYRGLLPEGTNVQEPVYLRYWPNLTRLEPVPNGMRIASLWCRQPVSLASLIGMLKIPQKQVFAFYVAANTIGLAGPATRQADGMLTASLPTMGVRSHTIIQQLANKLAWKNRSTQ